MYSHPVETSGQFTNISKDIVTSHPSTSRKISKYIALFNIAIFTTLTVACSNQNDSNGHLDASTAVQQCKDQVSSRFGYTVLLSKYEKSAMDEGWYVEFHAERDTSKYPGGSNERYLDCFAIEGQSPNEYSMVDEMWTWEHTTEIW